MKTYMRTHDLKCWRAQYRSVRSMVKPFEWRREDTRTFEIGDMLILHEWNESAGRYTGAKIKRVVTYVLRFGFGMPAGHVVLGLRMPRRHER